ncbi:MAG: PRD domain-containing protein, partial [Sarcina sp.]
IKEIKDNIIKLFSLENIINQLTILNPNKIIEEVSEIINRYQIYLNKDFGSELKLILFIHISSLIERMVMREEILESAKEEKFKEENMEFIIETEKIFKDVLDEYRVKLTVAEIINIYYIIKMRNCI